MAYFDEASPDRAIAMNQHANTDLPSAPPEWLVTLVERIVLESGDPTGFDALAWTAEWLATPTRVLGGRRPNEFLDTADGRDLITRLIGQMQSGAYA
jgi:hypothetical protein